MQSEEDNAVPDVAPEVEQQPPKKPRRRVALFSFALCKLCEGVLRDPVSTPCGHNFCRQCLAAKLRIAPTDGMRRCPQCSTTLRGLAPIFRANLQLAALVAVSSAAIGPLPKEEALQTLVRGMAEHPLGDSGFDDEQTLQRVVEGACMNEADLQRLKDFIADMQVRLVAITERRRIIEEHVPPAITARAGTGAILCQGEINTVWNYGVCAQARRTFPGLNHSTPYNLIVLPTRAEDFTEDGITALMRLPMYGIAAARTVFIIGCRSYDLSDITRKVLPAWGAEFGSIVAAWALDERSETPRTVVWVAAYVGPVQSLQTRREGRGIYNLRRKPIGDDIPLVLLTRFNSMFSSYSACCILGSTQTVAGWVSTKIVN